MILIFGSNRGDILPKILIYSNSTDISSIRGILLQRQANLQE